MAVISTRKELIDFLLKRRVGALAEPPLPLEGQSRQDAALAEAAYKRRLAIAGKADPRPSIETARKEYEALSSEELQNLVDEVRAEDMRKEQEWAAEVRSKREQRWPDWAQKDLWSEAEFAALCCGFVPEERGMPSDPGKVSGDSQAVAILRAMDDIRRGTLSRTLPFVPRDDEDTASRMYGTARHYVPRVAAEWAATRAKAFPQSLLSAVRERAQKFPVPERVTAASRWPWGDYETELLRKLAAAADKHWKLYDPGDPSTAPTSKDVVKWLKDQGVADRNAQVMATILRADGLPTGPRK